LQVAQKGSLVWVLSHGGTAVVKRKAGTPPTVQEQDDVTFSRVQSAIRNLGDPQIAEHSQRFFKTGKGEYGVGDRFLGIRVPVVRQQVKRFQRLSLEDTLRFLASDYHEERLFAVLMLVAKFQRGDEPLRKKIYQRYLEHTGRINNWDLVDSSAHLIVGAYLEKRSRAKLYRLAKSKDLWQRRIAIMATFYFIKQNDFDDALEISKLLLNDDHDLIHKAVGWMLREVGNRDGALERTFLKPRYKTMPRTMLRYAIEKFPEPERKRFLSGLN
jgi:3-methyladenine DNA glycosylase AlkD